MSISGTESITSGPTTGVNGILGSTGPSAPAADKEMFLQLMVAQLRYQDPMKPADSSQFMAQNAQFTALEKMQEVADQTRAVLGAQIAFGASSLVGRSVTYTLPNGTSGTGTVGGATFGADGPVLDVGGVQVPMANVTAVTAGSTPSGTAGSTTPSTTPTAS